jgi:ABC-2 type transport system ATP-binding protein
MSTPVIELDGVALRYRLAKQRIPSFKEYTIHLLKGTLSYEEFWALRDVDLLVERGERLGIVGRNGAGKSSLLKVISRVLRPTRGTAVVRGRLAPILELGSGFDFELTGWENIYLNALLLGHSRREIDQAIGGIVAFAELEEFIYSPIRNYSSGMLARLGFAIATAWVPDVLVLDEVLAVGDAAFQLKCEERMRRFHDAGTTILLVSHSPEAILDNCERAVWLDHGRIRADGAAAQTLDLYEREAAAEAAAAAQ